MQATRNLLPGGRWHFQHGPMDLVIQAEGEASAVAAAHESAWKRFAPLLQELVDELPGLRKPVDVAASALTLRGPVAQRMWRACRPYTDVFITPMAAVAGAVAQEIIAAYHRDGIARAWVNNGGDIALHLSPGQSAAVGVVCDISALGGAQMSGKPGLDGRLQIDSALPVRGVATSGWRGRSQSLGIADSVTVLARTAAEADAAATIVANAVNVDDECITRLPAWQVRDDSDLGARMVTVDVPPLPPDQVRRALHQGLEKAQELHSRGLVWGVLLACQGQFAATPWLQSGTLASLADAAPVSRGTPGHAAASQVGSVFA